MRLVKVVGGWPGATLVPPVSVKLDVEAPIGKVAREVRPGPTPKGTSRTGKPADGPSGSWWTARATTGEVKAGFSKDEILRKPDADPRAEGGMFSRVAGLLESLGG
jgi:hypothetical protein